MKKEDIIEKLHKKIVKIKKLEKDFKIIVKKYIFEDNFDNDNNSFLQEIIYLKSEKLALKIIFCSPNDFLKKTCELGYTVLHSAVATHSHRVAIILLNELGDEVIDKTDIYGKTVLHCAAYTNNTVIVPILLQKMTVPAINKFDNNGRTALHEAVFNNSYEVSKAILFFPNFQLWAIDKQDNEGKTALNYAIDNKNVILGSLLISKMSVLGLIATLYDSSNFLEIYNFMKRALIKFSVKFTLDPNSDENYSVKNNLIVALTYQTADHKPKESLLKTLNTIDESNELKENKIDLSFNFFQNNNFFSNTYSVNKNFDLINNNYNQDFLGNNSTYHD